MWPRRSTICGSAARTVRKTPSRSTSSTRSHSSPDIAVDGRHLLLGDPGVGDDAVEAAELLDHLGDRGHHRALVGDVGADPDRPRADPLGRLAGLLRIEVEDRDRGAAHLHLAGGLEADPARRAGHQRHLAVQIECRHRCNLIGLAGRHAADDRRRPQRRPRQGRGRPLLESGAMPGFAPVDPKQSFPDLEERALERWREQDLFARSLAERADAPIWCFYEGPPTANGRPGSHHVLARVFKDIYPRYRTMCGYRVPRKAGWDCHGLPVELEVEKQLGISSKEEIEEFGIAEFNQRCRESVFEYVEEWNRLTERIGFWVDLDDPYVTLEDRYIESVWWSLRQLFETRAASTRATRSSPTARATARRSPRTRSRRATRTSRTPRSTCASRCSAPSDESLLVWTTTPWTLPGQRGRRGQPDGHLRAGAARRRDADRRQATWSRRCSARTPRCSRSCPGAALVGRSYEGPVFDLARPRAAAASR